MINLQEIIKIKERRSGIKIGKEIDNVVFKRFVPRTTLCIIRRKRAKIDVYGISIKHPKDAYKQDLGQVKSFVRACNELIATIAWEEL